MTATAVSHLFKAQSFFSPHSPLLQFLLGCQVPASEEQNHFRWPLLWGTTRSTFAAFPFSCCHGRSRWAAPERGLDKFHGRKKAPGPQTASISSGLGYIFILHGKVCVDGTASVRICQEPMPASSKRDLPLSPSATQHLWDACSGRGITPQIFPAAARREEATPEPLWSRHPGQWGRVRDAANVRAEISVGKDTFPVPLCHFGDSR